MKSRAEALDQRIAEEAAKSALTLVVRRDPTWQAGAELEHQAVDEEAPGPSLPELNDEDYAELVRAEMAELWRERGYLKPVSGDE
jgi:hypothetical protein